MNYTTLWNESTKSLPDKYESCLAIRNNTQICNLYFDGYNWLDDWYDSRGEQVFTDVTHWTLLSHIPLPILWKK